MDGGRRLATTRAPRAMRAGAALAALGALGAASAYVVAPALLVVRTSAERADPATLDAALGPLPAWGAAAVALLGLGLALRAWARWGPTRAARARRALATAGLAAIAGGAATAVFVFALFIVVARAGMPNLPPNLWPWHARELRAAAAGAGAGAGVLGLCGLWWAVETGWLWPPLAVGAGTTALGLGARDYVARRGAPADLALLLAVAAVGLVAGGLWGRRRFGWRLPRPTAMRPPAPPQARGHAPAPDRRPAPPPFSPPPPPPPPPAALPGVPLLLPSGDRALVERIARWGAGGARDEAARRAGLAAEDYVHDLLVAGLEADYRVYRQVKVAPHLGREGDIDHLVLGPTGLVAIETKLLAGTLRYRAGGDWERVRDRPGHDGTPEAIGRPDRQLLRNVADLAGRLRREDPAAWRALGGRVDGLLVFVHPRTGIWRAPEDPDCPAPLLRPDGALARLRAWPMPTDPTGGRAPVLTAAELRRGEEALARLERGRLEQGRRPGPWWGRTLVGMRDDGVPHRDPTGRVALRLPPGWALATGAEAATGCAFAAANGPATLCVTIGARPAAAPGGPGEPVILARRPGYRRAGEADADGRRLRVVEYAVPGPAGEVLLTFASPADDALQPVVCDAIAGSLEFPN